MSHAIARTLERIEQGTDVISVAQACAVLSVHRNTLYRLIRDEEIPAFRLSRGGRWRFRRSDLEEWLAERAEKGAS